MAAGGSDRLESDSVGRAALRGGVPRTTVERRGASTSRDPGRALSAVGAASELGRGASDRSGGCNASGIDRNQLVWLLFWRCCTLTLQGGTSPKIADPGDCSISVHGHSPWRDASWQRCGNFAGAEIDKRQFVLPNQRHEP